MWLAFSIISMESIATLEIAALVEGNRLVVTIRFNETKVAWEKRWMAMKTVVKR